MVQLNVSKGGGIWLLRSTINVRCAFSKQPYQPNSLSTIRELWMSPIYSLWKILIRSYLKSELEERHICLALCVVFNRVLDILPVCVCVCLRGYKQCTPFYCRSISTSHTYFLHNISANLWITHILVCSTTFSLWNRRESSHTLWHRQW